jgi:hypothetical protein
MKRADAIVAAIYARWLEQEAAAICDALIKHIMAAPEERTQMLTYSDLAGVAHVSPDSHELKKALAILARYAAVEAGFVFFGEEGDHYYLAKDEAAEFLTTGNLAHPATGELVETPGTRVCPYFKGRRAFLREEA